VATNSLDTNQMIDVFVIGAVNQPGRIAVPKGATVLEAIRQAGGFGRVAFFSRVQVMRDSRTLVVMLATERVGPELPGHYYIWYGGDERRSDFVLEDEDKILVGATL